MYAGSFDPVTIGHFDIIQRGAKLFDELVVAIGSNPTKRYWFSQEKRQQLIQEICADLPNVRVSAFSGLLVHACEAEGATVILRGLRVLSDFDGEFRNGLANRDISGIETVFLLADPQFIFVSSSLVKEIAERGGDVSRYVNPPVLKALQHRLGST